MFAPTVAAIPSHSISRARPGASRSFRASCSSTKEAARIGQVHEHLADDPVEQLVGGPHVFFVADVRPERLTDVRTWVDDHVPQPLNEPERVAYLPVEYLARASWQNGGKPSGLPDQVG